VLLVPVTYQQVIGLYGCDCVGVSLGQRYVKVSVSVSAWVCDGT
jgi:hypothetical protein